MHQQSTQHLIANLIETGALCLIGLVVLALWVSILMAITTACLRYVFNKPVTQKTDKAATAPNAEPGQLKKKVKAVLSPAVASMTTEARKEPTFSDPAELESEHETASEAVDVAQNHAEPAQEVNAKSDIADRLADEFEAHQVPA